MKLRILVAGAAALALSACGSKAPSEPPTDAATEGAMAENPGGMMGESTSAAAPDMTGQAFADTAAASDLFEIESSKLAQAQAKDAKVKAFAGMMIEAHTKSTADLKAAAAKASPAVIVAPKLTPEQDADLAALKAAGADFDRVYVEKQVAGHEKTLAAVQAYAARGDVAALKEFAAKTAPVVSGHLEEARKLPR